MSKDDRTNRKIRKIDKKYSKNHNRQHGKAGGWSNFPIVLAAMMMIVTAGVRIKKTPKPGKKRGCWLKGFGG